jgi:hypothetical protein
MTPFAALNKQIEDTNMQARMFAASMKYLALENGSWAGAAQRAKNSRAFPQIVDVLNAVANNPTGIHKAATDPLSTSGFGDQLAEFQQLSSAFLLSLRTVSAFEAMTPFMRMVPIGLQNFAVQTGGATAATVGEGQMKPITKFSFARSQLTPSKSLAIVVVTEELLRHSNINSFMTDLQRAVATEVDAGFVTKLTTGASYTASAGSAGFHILVDLHTALAGLDLDAASKVFLLVSEDIAKHWSVAMDQSGALMFPQMTPNGGTVQGMQVIPTAGVSQSIVAVDASQIAASAGNLEPDATREGTINMDTAPDSPPTASTNYRALWQENETALRVTRYWAAERLRTNAVHAITGVSYSGNSPA